MKKIMTIVGARPQFIKASTVSRVIEKSSDIEEFVVHTGQHYDQNMSDIFFEELMLRKPDLNLAIGSHSQGRQTALMLDTIEELLLAKKPDCLLIYGDTNSTLAGALAAAKLHISVAHVEAGLRSFNRRMPEEVNRIVSDQVSDYLFAPTQTAVNNLQKEGFSDERIHLVGDVMYDAALFYGKQVSEPSTSLVAQCRFDKPFILVTIHRAENTNDPNRLKIIVQALQDLSREHTIILPLHPRTRAALLQYNLLDGLIRAITVIEPVGYLDMIYLEKQASLILTDSGGVQKEAYFYQTPCVTVRDQTEWLELLDVGANILVAPTTSDAIVNGVAMMWGHNLSEQANLYGAGDAAERVFEVLSG